MIVLFECNNPECDNSIEKIFKSAKDISSFLDCGACGTGKLERQLGAPSSKSTQVLDNGNQARSVEIMDAVIEKERNRLYEE